MPEGTTILDAAQQAGIPIPHLCFLKDINEIAACRMCVVEIEGIDRLVPACDNAGAGGHGHPHQQPPGPRGPARPTCELILSQHNSNCTTCIRSGNCALADPVPRPEHPLPALSVQPERSRDRTSGRPLIREASKCIKCMRCVQVCDKVQGHAHLGRGRHRLPHHRGRVLQPPAEEHGLHLLRPVRHPLSHRRPDRPGRHQRGCCDALADPEITTVVQVAPAVRVAWAEAFGLAPAVRHHRQAGGRPAADGL